MYFCRASPIWFLILLIWVLSLFFLMNLAKDLSIFFIFSKNQLLVSLIFCYYFLSFYFIYFCSDLYYFLLQRKEIIGFACSFSSWYNFLNYSSFHLSSDNTCFVSVFYLYLSRSQFVAQRRQWHPTPVLLPGKSHGRRSLVGCSPWGHEESDTTARLHFHFLLSCIGERNGNPLQCSCLENPRDSGAWWAAVYRVAQSRTRLKRLSSSSSNLWLK